MILKEASKKHDIPERTLRTAIEDKRLTAKKVGIQWNITPSAMRKYLKSYYPRPNKRINENNE